MLGVARRDDDETANGAVPSVPDRVGRAPRHEDEATTCHGDIAVTEQKGCVALGDVERLVGVRVQVQRRRRLGRRKHPDDCDVGTGHLGRTKMGRFDQSEKGMTVHPLTVCTAAAYASRLGQGSGMTPERGFRFGLLRASTA